MGPDVNSPWFTSCDSIPRCPLHPWHSHLQRQFGLPWSPWRVAGPGTSRLRAAGDAGAAGAADGTGTRLPADGVTTAGAHVGSAADSAADAGNGRFGELGKLGKLAIFVHFCHKDYIPILGDGHIKHCGCWCIPLSRFGSGIEGIAGPDLQASVSQLSWQRNVFFHAMVVEPPKSMGIKPYLANFPHVSYTKFREVHFKALESDKWPSMDRLTWVFSRLFETAVSSTNQESVLQAVFLQWYPHVWEM